MIVFLNFSRFFIFIVAVIGINLQTCWTAIDHKGVVEQSWGMDQGNHINQKSSKSQTEHGGDIIQKTSSTAADKEFTMKQVQLGIMEPSSETQQGDSMDMEGDKVHGAAVSQLELKDRSLKTIMRSHLINHQNTLEDL